MTPRAFEKGDRVRVNAPNTPGAHLRAGTILELGWLITVLLDKPLSRKGRRWAARPTLLEHLPPEEAPMPSDLHAALVSRQPKDELIRKATKARRRPPIWTQEDVDWATRRGAEHMAEFPRLPRDLRR